MSVSYVGTVGHQLLTFEESNLGDQALCVRLSVASNLAPGSTPRGPKCESHVYTLADGTTVNGTPAGVWNQLREQSLYENRGELEL